MELFHIVRHTENDQKKQNEDETALKRILERAKKKQKHKQVDESKITTNESKENEIATHAECTSELEPQPPPSISQAEPSPSSDNDGDFPMLGEDVNKKKQAIEAVLPPWLAHPTIIDSDLNATIEGAAGDADTNDDDLEKLTFLNANILSSLRKLKVRRLFPVQKVLVPWIFDAHKKPAPFRPRDVCVSAPTGSGKTLAFAIPIVQLLEDRVEPKIRALVILPVGELALQVFKVFNELCKKTSLKVCLLSNQSTVAAQQEKLVEKFRGKFYTKVDIVVSTPGRLVEHIHETKGFCLKALKFLVIDEADRIMDAAFHNWLQHYEEHMQGASDHSLYGPNVPICLLELQRTFQKVPHKMLFSATLSQDPEKLQNMRLFHPKLFTSVQYDVNEIAAKLIKCNAQEETKPDPEQKKETAEYIGKYVTPKELTEKYCVTELRLKPLTIFALIKECHWKKFICFTNNRESSRRLFIVLSSLLKTIGLKIGLLTADSSHGPLKKFARGALNGLICSDVLARGIDVDDVEIVISYDLPRDITAYIHRIGRTARAGRPGTAVTILTEGEHIKFRKLLNSMDKDITEEIKISPDAEITYAKEYTKALDDFALQMRLKDSKKNKRKKTVNSAALVHKDPSKLTLIEKLQLKAEKQLFSNNEKEDKAPNAKRPKLSKNAQKNQKKIKK